MESREPEELDESESSFNENKRSSSQEWSDKRDIERDSDLGSSKGFGESGDVNRGSSDLEE